MLLKFRLVQIQWHFLLVSYFSTEYDDKAIVQKYFYIQFLKIEPVYNLNFVKVWV